MELLIEKIKTIAEELSYADPRNKAYIKVENTAIKINFSEFLSFYADWLLNPQNQEKIKEMIYLEITKTIPSFINVDEEEIEKLKFSLDCRNDEEFKKIFQPLLSNTETIADNIDQKIKKICLNEILGRIAEEKEERKKKIYHLYINYN